MRRHLPVIVWFSTAASTAAQAEDGHFIPVFSYRTGAFAGSGIAQANGFTDYLEIKAVEGFAA